MHDESRMTRFAEALFRRCLPEGTAQEGVLGDLRETYEVRREQHGRRAADRWYRRETMKLASCYLW